MATGTVKWFDNPRGFGFIVPDDNSNDVFAHYSQIKSEGYKSLKEGDKVSFGVKDTPKGRQATEIEKIPKP